MALEIEDMHYSRAMITPEVEQAALRALRRNTPYYLTRETKELEKRFAEYCGTKQAVAVSSGTAAEFMSLMALGVGRGDEVITTPNTFIATVDCIVHVGGTPVFVEIDEETYTMNPDLLEDAITDKTKAIIPVHMYGHPADMDPIRGIADEHRLFVIEDAAHAAGASYKSKKTGHLGTCGFFSVASKNITAGGDGGLLTTDDEQLASKIRMLRNHGREADRATEGELFDHRIPGFNFRMSEVAAAIVGVQLQHLDEYNQTRRRHAGIYNELLAGVKEIKLPIEKEWAHHVYLHYPIRVKNRNALQTRLSEAKIRTKVFYNPIVPLQPYYREKFGYKPGMFPESEREKSEVLSLPVSPSLSDEQIKYVANTLKSICLKD